MDNHETLLSSNSPPIPLIQHSTTTSANDKHDTVTGAIVTNSNSANYATVTINNNNATTPVNPPTGEVTGDNTKVLLVSIIIFFIILF